MSLFRILTYRTFEPSEISGLMIWLDASVITDADGSSISNWNDSTVNNYDFYQSNSIYQPKFYNNVQNGLGVVRFDGTNDNLINMINTDVLKNVAGATIFSVIKYPNTATTNTGFIASDGTSTKKARAKIGQNTSKKYISSGKRLDAETEETVTSGMITTNTFVIQQATYNFASANLTQSINDYIDGVDSTFTTAGNTSNSNSVLLGIGANYEAPSAYLYPSTTLTPSSATYFTGDIGEILVFNRVLTTLESFNVNRYLSIKWGISLTELVPSTSLFPDTSLFLGW